MSQPPDDTTLARVFAKLPPHTSEELALIIERFRASRAQFLATGKGTKTPKPKASGTKLNLSDLEL